MKRDNLPIENDLRPEYNLKELRVRKVGSKRKISQARTIQHE